MFIVTLQAISPYLEKDCRLQLFITLETKGFLARFLCLTVEKPLWVFIKMSLGNIQKAFLYLGSLKAGVLQNRQDVTWEEVCHPH